MAYPLQFQDEVFKTLERFKEGGRFPHALIFEGPPGSGKRTAARYAASMLLCREGKSAPCMTCRSCRRSLDNHPDFSVILPENKSRTVSVDKIRELRLSAYVSPHEGDKKVYFIPEAQRMRTEAQNALLKLMEEPPDAACFILTVNSRASLLETVLSRAAVISMRELEAQERLSVLHGKGIAEGEELKRLAYGCSTVGEAERAAADPKAAALISDAVKLLDCLLSGRRYQALTLLCGYENDRESYLSLFQTVRNAVISRLCGQDNALSALRANKIIDIIDKIAFSASQNAALPLLSCAAVNRLISAAFAA